MLILPWFTLFFMKKEEIKRYMPAALFSSITSMVVVEYGQTFHWWAVYETIYPLRTTIPYLLGLVPIITLWLLRFIYGHFWLYMGIDIVLNYGFLTIFLAFLANRGIMHSTMSELAFVSHASVHGAIIYLFQIWQEGIFVRGERTNFSTNLQPAVAKPLQEKQDNQQDNAKE